MLPCRSKVEGQKPLGLRLIGEACVPRIDVANLQAMFASEPALTLVHRGTPSSRHQTSKAGAPSQPGASLDVEGRAYSFGLVLARVQRAMPSGIIRQASNVANAPGSVARLSIKNLGKVGMEAANALPLPDFFHCHLPCHLFLGIIHQLRFALGIDRC